MLSWGVSGDAHFPPYKNLYGQEGDPQRPELGDQGLCP